MAVNRLLVGISAFALLGLVGCDKPKAQENPTEAAAVYSSVDDCKATHSESDCQQAFEGAQQEQDTTAPHMTLGECVDQYGANACIPRESGSYYVPMMAGFTLGVVAGSLSAYHPVYVDLHGSAYYHGNYIGTYHPSCYGCTHTTVIHISPRAPQTFTSSITRAPIPPSARNLAPSPPAMSSNRGGFGGRGSATTASPAQKTMTTPSSPPPAQRTMTAPSSSPSVNKPSTPSPSINRPSYTAPSPSPSRSYSAPSSSSRGGFGGGRR